MSDDPIQQQKEYAQIVARAWADEEFKARLLLNPAQVLREYGIAVPEGVEVRAVENTDTVVHFVLPARPKEELTEEHLERISGGVACSCCQYCDFFCWP